MKKQVKRRIRWDRVALLLLIVVFCMSFAVNALADSTVIDCQSVTVGAGDTIWALIREVNPEYTGNMEKAVYQTCRLNGMDSAKICVGQSILIPNL